METNSSPSRSNIIVTLKFQLMNRISSLLLLVFPILYFSCSTDPFEVIPNESEVEEIDTTLIWKVPLNPDTSYAFPFSKLTLYQDKLVTSAEYTDEVNYTSTSLVCYNTEGQLQWSWKDLDGLRFIRDEGSIDNLIFVNQDKNAYCFDINTGEQQWYYGINSGVGNWINGSNEGLVFKPIRYGGTPQSDSVVIMVADVQVGEFQEVFKIRLGDNEHDGNGVSIPNVLHYKDDNNDDILVFQVNNLFMPPNYKEMIDLYSYNLTQKEIMWKKESIADGHNVHIPQMDDDNIYFATKYDFFSFNKKTGTQNWNTSLYWDFQGSNYVLHKDFIVTNLDNGDLIALSKHNGQIVWIKEQLSYCCSKLRVYDDKIFFGNGDLFIVDIYSGDVLLRYSSDTPSDQAIFYNRVAVDLPNNRMYVQDGYFLFALNIPEW